MTSKTDIKTKPSQIVPHWDSSLFFRFIIFFLISFASQNIVAQKETLDLEKEILEETNDSIKLEKTKELVKVFRRKDLNKHFAFSNQGLVLAQNQNHKLYELMFYRELGLYYYYQSKFDSALFYIELGKLIGQNLEDKMPLSGLLIDNANVYKKQGKYDEAASIYHETLGYFEETNKADGLVGSYLGLASIYSIQKKYREAIDVCKKCELQCDQLGKRKLPCNGVVFTNLSSFYSATGELDSALLFAKKALAIKKKMGDKRGLIKTYHALFVLYFQKKEYQKAIENIENEKTLAISLKSKEALIRSYNGLGSIYIAMNQNQMAMQMLDSSRHLLEETKNPYQYRLYHKKLVGLYEKAGDFKSSLFHLKQLNSIEDSLYNKDREKTVNELETKYKTKELIQEKKLETERAKNNENKYYGMLIIALLILLLGAFIIRQMLQKRKVEHVKTKLKETEQKLEFERKLNQSELAALKAQMNPHFLFNAFNSIQEFIILNEKELASDYLGNFADLMRIYLNHSQEKSISLEDEIKSATLYLGLEKLRFGNSLEFTVKVDELIDTTYLELPPMLIQPCIENALKHGLLHKKTDRKIDLKFKVNKFNALICIVEDNGIGREASVEINKNRNKDHKSFATSAINNRIELMNQSRKKPIEIKIIDLFENEIACGTRVELIVPQ